MRWTAARKAGVIAAVRRLPDLTTTILKNYGISQDELREWEKIFDEHGIDGLRTTKLQKYRETIREKRSTELAPSEMLPKHPPFRK